MTASDVERQLTALLHRHAEEAMNKTDTSAELNKFQERAQQDPGGTGRRRAAMLAAAAAAAVGAGALWYATVMDTDDRSAPATDPESSQTADERVAQDFLEALTTEDFDTATSYLAADAQMPEGWRDTTLTEAYSVEHFVQPCETTSTSALGARIECPFEYHARGSEQLGLEPFDASMFTVIVDDGEVRSFDALYGRDVNGEADLRDDIGAWVEENYPGDWEVMDPSSAPEDEQRFIELWQERTQQYVDAMTGE